MSLILKGSAQLLDGNVPLQVVVVRRTGVKEHRRNSVSNNGCQKLFFVFVVFP